MLFDERPKERREDLYDREKEIEELKRSIGRPLILLTGIRRIGKTSVLRVALSELDIPYVLIDARSLRRNYSRSDLFRLIAQGLSGSLDKIKDLLMGIRGLRVMGVEVEVSWRGSDSLSLVELFDRLNKKKIVIAIDEAQRLRGPRSSELKDAIAHAYDYDQNISFILTGSEVGLLYDFIGIEDSRSPLYGRYYVEVKLERLSREQSIDFLRKGFAQLNLRVSEEVLEVAYEHFDGIPGWLTFFGNAYARGEADIEKMKSIAVRTALEELRNMTRDNPRRYGLVLRAIAEGRKTWSQVKEYLEEKEGTTISSSVLSNILRSLEDMSIIKNYEFLDPIYREACKLLQ
ncbi:ATP-binding protein [Thermofilum sp.]|uniref:AAA family ATPase n=2 Tax=Thermofilum sp. TaxID=1961369 RepID=UPI00258588DA|nr:ATP-binding protein [Thermofilum sp.]